MAQNIIKRSYKFNDGKLSMAISNFCYILERDLSDLIPYGLTQSKIGSLKAKCDLFELFHQDFYSIGM